VTDGRATGELLIVTGPPGAGKSTVATRLADARSPSVLVEGDEFFRFLRQGRIDPWLPASQRQNEHVTEAAASSTGRFARDYWTVYDGVLGPWFVPTFLAATALPTAHYVVLLPDVERCLRRVATRVGHGFSDAGATRHMHEQFAAPTVAERHVLRDPPDDVDVLAEHILELVDVGTVRL
jgi:cytidylate kinase